MAQDTDVWFIQEHRMPQHRLRDARAAAQRAGWRAHFAATGPAPARGGASGGVAIMVRRPLGSRTIAWPEAEEQHARGRLVACTHPCGRGQQIVAISIYGVVHAGVAGNTDLLRTLFQFIYRLRHGAWIIGGDWNLTPEELMSFGLARASRGRIQSPGRQDSGECREIDYFLVGPAVHASGWAASFYVT